MPAATTRPTPEAPEQQPERRLGRADLQLPVQVSSRGASLAAVATNLSLGGMFVASPRCLRIGDQVAVRLSILDESEPIEIAAEVRWCREVSEGDWRPTGMGLRFTEPLLEAAIFVRVLLRLSRLSAL